MWMRFAGAALALVLAGCGGGGPAPTGKEVNTPAFTSYTTDHNGYSRIRKDNSDPADAAVIAEFEDSDPATPAGYRELIQLADAHYTGSMTIEVIAEVADVGGTEKTKRILRLTADQAPFENVKNGKLVTATGTYYLRGQNFAWVSLDGGDLLSGQKTDGGLVTMELNFDTQTVNLILRTDVEAGSEVTTLITANNLPFNIVTGAYGGDVTIEVTDPNAALTYAIDGSLRGNVGGSPTYSGGTHGMTTSGLYTATGTDQGVTVTVDGVYYGTDPNALD
jgi:hypothetical protein